MHFSHFYPRTFFVNIYTSVTFCEYFWARQKSNNMFTFYPGGLFSTFCAFFSFFLSFVLVNYKTKQFSLK